VVIAAATAALALLPNDASAAQQRVGLGTAESAAILAGSSVTNVGPSTINGDLGLSPGTAVTGFPPATLNGTLHVADAVAAQAKADLKVAYDDAAGRTPALAVTGDLGGLMLTPGVYRAPSSLGLTGAMTLDAQGDPNAVFIFQVGSSLTTASASVVNLINGAQSCNVFWQIGTSATLGTASTFAGSILAHSAITINDAVVVYGRALAQTAAVTLINDTITPVRCAAGTTGGPEIAGGGGTGGGDTSGGGTGGGGTGGGGTGGGGTGVTATVPGVNVQIVPGAGVSVTAGDGSGGGPAAGGTAGEQADTGNANGNGTALFTTTPRKIARTIAQFGATRCIDGSFKAVVTGLFIRRVVFSQDGRVIATRNKAPWQALVGAGQGIHTVVARVTFSDGTPPAKLKMRFKACGEAVRSANRKKSRPARSRPAFTG